MEGFSNSAWDDHVKDVAAGNVSTVPEAPDDRDIHPEAGVINVSAEQAEQMALLEWAAHADPDSATEFVSECEDYLKLVDTKIHELEGGHPQFSHVIQTWVEDEYQAVSANGEPRDESELTIRAGIYEQLRAEMSGDYSDAIKAGNTEAVAEWDVVNQIISEHVNDLVVRDAMNSVKARYGLAA